MPVEAGTTLTDTVSPIEPLNSPISNAENPLIRPETQIEKLQKYLEETLKHVDPNESFQLAKNPPIQDSQQGLELMVHRMISDAKQEGKRYIIFPKLADYASARSSGNPKNTALQQAHNELGSILKNMVMRISQKNDYIVHLLTYLRVLHR